jgi:hypothetical protein
MTVVPDLSGRSLVVHMLCYIVMLLELNFSKSGNNRVTHTGTHTGTHITSS